MKTTLILLLLLCVGCRVDPPNIGGKIPFIVISVKTTPDGCQYECPQIPDGEGTPFKHREIIILPCGLYQIGDTIKPKDFK